MFEGRKQGANQSVLSTGQCRLLSQRCNADCLPSDEKGNWNKGIMICELCTMGGKRTKKSQKYSLNTVYLRSISCAMFSYTLLSSLFLKVERVDFSDPQGGKGPCDRKAATIKAHIRRYINEGHDVQTATDLCNAILSRGGVRGVRVALIYSNILPIPAVKLVGISTLNNFQFSAKGLTYWKAYKIGEGKMITWSKLHG